MSRFVLVSFAVVLLALGLSHAAPDEDPQLLIIEVEGGAVGVLEPPGWLGQLNGVNVAFCRSGETPDHASSLIRVQVEIRTDKSASDNFAVTAEGFRSKFPELTTTALEFTHPAYGAVSKLFSVPNRFYEYVVYVAPKKRGPVLLMAAMNTKDRPATEEEMNAFTLVVRSLILLKAPKG